MTEGWGEPDTRGHITYTKVGVKVTDEAPDLPGFECYWVEGWIGARGDEYTRWMYKPLVCLDRGDDCDGTVEYRMPLSGTGKSFPRCEHHWQARLDVQQQIDERYPDSPIPPADFDPHYAGETWDEE